MYDIQYLRSDSERKLVIGQFDLTHVKKVELESPDMFENHPWSLTGGGGLFICSKLVQNLSEMEVRTFVRMQRVIWDHLLVLRLKLSRSKLYFSFCAGQLTKNNIRADYAVCSVLSFVLISSFFSSFLSCRRTYSQSKWRRVVVLTRLHYTRLSHLLSSVLIMLASVFSMAWWKTGA